MWWGLSVSYAYEWVTCVQVCVDGGTSYFFLCSVLMMIMLLSLILGELMANLRRDEREAFILSNLLSTLSIAL